MRSKMIRKRALEQTSDVPGTWSTTQGVRESDLPGDKAVNPPSSEIKPEIGKDAGSTDWAENIIKSTVQWAMKHRGPFILSEASELPITRKFGIAALRDPFYSYATTGDANKLTHDLEMLFSGKRSIASKRKRAQEQPEVYPTDNRVAPEESDSVDTKTSEKIKGTPTSWAVDNTREQWHKAKGASTPNSWAVDNTRELPQDSKKMTGDEQIEEKMKNGSLELYTPKSASEIDMIIASSPEWVGRRVASGSVAYCTPRFIINASHAVAVVNDTGEVFDEISAGPTDKYSSLLHTAAEGGAEEEEETEAETSVDSSVVSLLEACKREWTSLGEPVNPGTWPKEIERAILALNDDLVAAIKKTEDKLVEGEFYSKNVDEGVESAGGSNLMGLNVAEPEYPVEESVEETEKESKSTKTSSKTASLKIVKPKSVEEVVRYSGGTKWSTSNIQYAERYFPHISFVVDTDTNKAVAAHDSERNVTLDVDDAKTNKYDYLFTKTSSKTAAEDVTSAETRKALKHVQSLKDDIASKFFDFKKDVQSANDSTPVKNIGETLISLKVKLEDVEKILSKQLDMLASAEKAIEDKKKKAAFEDQARETVGKSSATKKANKIVVPSSAEEFFHLCKGTKLLSGQSIELARRDWDLLTYGGSKIECLLDDSGKFIAAKTKDGVWNADDYQTHQYDEEFSKARETVGKSSAVKTAACPTCGAKVMQNGKDTNGVMCPNCAAKTTTTPSSQQPKAPSSQQPAPSSQPVSPAAPNRPGSPIKQYGSKQTLAGLNIASKG